ncbi:LCP family protein [Caldibacillus lycopersici]|uniref:LCP family protein n=1 Tax=Perspicuibacillus lycopersici TaxID=1325689 RepID=A0AAE3IRE6_9BACI|nr:LCP family protein [Perspicuibacillus lycopersici]MCU9613205.1 LCP family protein [Perspicuibacillus lycopersici]
MAHESQSREIRKKQKKKRSKKRIFFITLPFLIIILAVVGYAVNLYLKAENAVSKSYEDTGREKSELREEVVDPTEDNISILIIGVDTSEKRANDGNPRSDTLILATLNKHTNSVKLLSIPRDSYVYIPEVGYETRINAAHAYGGPKATIETVENLLDVPVDYYVKLNFEAFIDVVDALDGVTIDVPFEFYEQNSKDEPKAIHLLPGVQELDGEEALAFARTRKIDNDIERGKRQQEVIKAVIKKAASAGSLFKYDDVIEAVGENMTTDLTFAEMRGLISYGLKGTLSIESMTLAGSDSWPNGAYYYQLDQLALDETKEILQEHLELNSTGSSNLTDSDTSNTDGTTDTTGYNDTNGTTDSDS